MLANNRASLVGATIGNYEVVDKLGEGGMGTVYLARHPQIGKRVAVKVLHEEFSANQDVVTRFFNEAKAVNEIGHPNIVDVIDFGVIEQERGPRLVYFIMEFLDGESLAATIEREGALDPGRAVRIARQVSAALAASHAKGIVHRDLKPDNVVIVSRAGGEETAKVLDFGIAKLTGGQAGSQRTRTGIVMGTPAYMSPEQCEGKADLDHRADVYALGVLIYEMLVGQPPFVGEGYGQILLQHLTKVPRPITLRRSEVSVELDAVVQYALRKDRNARFASMEAFDRALADPAAFVKDTGGIEQFFDEESRAHIRLPEIVPARGRHAVRLAIVLAVVVAVAGLLVMRGDDEGEGDRVRDGAQGEAATQVPAARAPQTQVPAVAVVPAVVVAPARVTVEVAAGAPVATVFVGAEEKPRGPTPITLEFPRGEAVSLRVDTAGHISETRAFSPEGDRVETFTLVRAPVVTPQGRATKVERGPGSVGRPTLPRAGATKAQPIPGKAKGTEDPDGTLAPDL